MTLLKSFQVASNNEFPVDDTMIDSIRPKGLCCHDLIDEEWIQEVA